MEIFAAITNWISERESLLSGAAAIIVLVSIVVSALGIIVRKLMRIRRADLASKVIAPEGKITLRDLSAPAPYPIHFAQSDGLRIAYAICGEDPPDLVMTPGIICHLNIMSHFPPIRDTFNALCAFSRVLCFDKRGQGLSDPSIGVPDLAARVRDIKAVMDAAGMERVILYGCSDGGTMCLQFAHDYPERVKGMVLLGTTPRWVQSDDFPMGLTEHALDGVAARWGTGSLRRVFFPSISRDVLDDETYQDFERLNASRESMQQLVAYMKETDVRALLPNITCPTLVIHFGGDMAVPIRMGRALAESLPNAEFLEVSGVDHADLSQSPEGVERVRQFVNALG